LDQGHRISLILHGTGGLADAVGARVTVRAGGRLFVREVVAGGSYVSCSDNELLIGLGKTDVIDTITIRWPGGESSSLDGLPVDQRHHIAFGGQLLRSEPFAESSPR
ncbi:MAG: hypothetical protein ACI9EF_002853, partial [Pseudohongiellaceae bacterium]